MSKLTDRFLLQIVAIGLPRPEAEYHFAPQVDGRPARKWRFDFAWPDALVAVEIQGGTWVAKGSAGYHGSGRGIEQDAEKLNAAVAIGWRVALVTSPMVSSGDGLRILRILLGKLDPGVLFQSPERSD
jgi:hypothetical protein